MIFQGSTFPMMFSEIEGAPSPLAYSPPSPRALLKITLRSSNFAYLVLLTLPQLTLYMSSATSSPLPTWDNFLTSTHISHETKERITREVLEIKRRWNDDWQDDLRNGGINIQDQPSFHLANTLAQLAAFEPDLTRLLATLADFRAFQAAQAPIAGKIVDPRTSSLFGTVEQRVEYTSYRFLEAWLEYLKPPGLSPSVDTGRAKRAAARAAAKRRAPPSPANTSRRRRTCASSPLVEVGRAQDANSLAADDTTIGEGELGDGSTYLDTVLGDTGVQLTFDEELTISTPTVSPSATRDRLSPTPSNMSSGIANMLQDPLLRQLAKLLCKTKHQENALKNNVQEAGIALNEARDKRDTVRQTIQDEPAIEVDTAVDSLETAIEELETDRTAEQKLCAFLTAHQDEYRRLASASASAANNADALSSADAEDAIAELSAKIDVYEDAKNRLVNAETAFEDAEKAHIDSKEALTTFRKRLKEVRDTTQDWNNDFRFSTLDDELARVEDEGIRSS